MTHIFKVLSLSILLIFSSLSFAAGSSQTASSTPYVLIQNVGNQLFSDIAKLNELDEKTKREQLKLLIKNQLMPHIDTKFVSFKLLGKHVREIKKEQAVTFIDAVEQYLVGTYTNVLMSYKGQEVHFIEPVFDAASQYASVKSEIVAEGAPTIDMIFKFRKSKSGQWQVYDIEAESISLLSAKQKEIVSRISEIGIDAVSKELIAKS
ncbi:MlaC/ttg2D family ABC transporter substrate-binding protein [Pseudoalteromonas xiamenensis]